VAGIEWQYEPEGFETPHGRYLPDFKILVRLGVVGTDDLLRIKPSWIWIEIKNEEYLAGPEDQERYRAVVEGTGQPLMLLFGLDSGAMLLVPGGGLYERTGTPEFITPAALDAARSARFEHGRSGT